MAAIDYQCPRCRKFLRIPEQFIGQEGRCSRCHHKFLVEPESARDEVAFPEAAPRAPRMPKASTLAVQLIKPAAVAAVALVVGVGGLVAVLGAPSPVPYESQALAQQVDPEQAAAVESRAKVISITDGDTLTVLQGTTQTKIRLHGIDAPESGQDFGARAKQKLSELAYGEHVEVVKRDTDRYGRLVADLYLEDGTRINEALVWSGLAWWYQRYAPNDTALRTAQEGAAAAKYGLWADPNPIPPWEFRNGRSNSGDASPREHVTTTAPTRGSPAVSQPSAPAVAPSNATAGEVYITKTGKKYHRGGCRYLSKSKIPISRKDADARGYGACSVCRP